ncbi:MAG: GNAT family N-acetyltransferase [Myxococcales bacterium]|jgi:ribosomal-protein-alanine N-acetyltransferase
MASGEIETVETARLVGRSLRPGDEALLAAILQDEQASRTVGGLRTDDEVRRLLRRMLGHSEAHGFGTWVFFEREFGRYVGYGGLLRTKAGGELNVEIMYALLPSFGGRALATEIAEELVRIGFEALGLDRLVSYTVPANTASRRVMEKCGFCFEREIVYAGTPHVLYSLDAGPQRAAQRTA